MPGIPASKKFGLAIGINYVGSGPNELGGCQADAMRMKNLWVQQLGFQDTPEQMKVLMDDGIHQMPNKDNIGAAVKWLMSKAAPGVQLFVHVASHGSPHAQITGRP